MPDYPFVYGTGQTAPIQPEATRLRVPRRRAREEGEEEGAEEQARRRQRWRVLLEDAVEQLNATLEAGETGFVCELEEEGGDFVLVVRRRGGQGPPEPLEEEVLETDDLPRWLNRLRQRLGVLVDEKA